MGEGELPSGADEARVHDELRVEISDLVPAEWVTEVSFGDVPQRVAALHDIYRVTNGGVFRSGDRRRCDRLADGCVRRDRLGRRLVVESEAGACWWGRERCDGDGPGERGKQQHRRDDLPCHGRERADAMVASRDASDGVDEPEDGVGGEDDPRHPRNTHERVDDDRGIHEPQGSGTDLAPRGDLCGKRPSEAGGEDHRQSGDEHNAPDELGDSRGHRSGMDRAGHGQLLARSWWGWAVAVPVMVLSLTPRL